MSGTWFPPGDFRGTESRFSPENLPHNLALVALGKKMGGTKISHTCENRSGVADGTKTLDRADPWDNPEGAYAPEYRRD